MSRFCTSVYARKVTYEPNSLGNRMTLGATARWVPCIWVARIIKNLSNYVLCIKNEMGTENTNLVPICIHLCRI
jgi:hypothetical protein